MIMSVVCSKLGGKPQIVLPRQEHVQYHQIQKSRGRPIHRGTTQVLLRKHIININPRLSQVIQLTSIPNRLFALRVLAT